MTITSPASLLIGQCLLLNIFKYLKIFKLFLNLLLNIFHSTLSSDYFDNVLFWEAKILRLRGPFSVVRFKHSEVQWF